MAPWIARSVCGGVTNNGTTSHTCTFTPAQPGSFLVAVVSAASTSTTPTGWSKVNSALGSNSSVYLFTKTAVSGESSFSTTHGVSDLAIQALVYEFPAGSSVPVGASGSANGLNVSGATVGQPGVAYSTPGVGYTMTNMAARDVGLSGTTATASCVWSTPATKDYDAYVPHTTTDGVGLTIAYETGRTGTGFSPSSQYTATGTTYSGEALSWAVKTIITPSPLTGTGNETTAVTSSSSATSITVAKPANVVDGDLMVASVALQSQLPSGATMTAPTGWTILTAQPPTTGGSAARAHVMWAKPVPSASAESATSYTFSTSSGTAGRYDVRLNRVVGADLSAFLDASGAQGVGSTSPYTIPGVTTATVGTLLMMIFHMTATSAQVPNSVTTPSGWTDLGTLLHSTYPTAGSDDALYSAYSTQTAAGSTASPSVAFSPAQTTIGGAMTAIKAAPIATVANASATASFSLTGAGTASPAVVSSLTANSDSVQTYGNPSWASAITFTNSLTLMGGLYFCYSDDVDDGYFAQETFLEFDTSNVPAGASINSLTFNLFANSTGSNISPDVYLCLDDYGTSVTTSDALSNTQLSAITNKIRLVGWKSGGGNAWSTTVTLSGAMLTAAITQAQSGKLRVVIAGSAVVNGTPSPDSTYFNYSIQTAGSVKTSVTASYTPSTSTPATGTASFNLVGSGSGASATPASGTASFTVSGSGSASVAPYVLTIPSTTDDVTASAPNITGTTLTGTRPNNMADGDVLYALVFSRTSSSTSTNSSPPGWVKQQFVSSIDTFEVWTKPIPSASSEAALAQPAWTQTASGRWGVLIGRVVGAPQSGYVSVVGSTVSGTTTPQTVPGVTTAAANEVGLLFAQERDSQAATPTSVIQTPSGFTLVKEAFTGQSGSWSSGAVFYTPAQPSATAIPNVTLTAAGGGISALEGFILTFKPAGTPPFNPQASFSVVGSANVPNQAQTWLNTHLTGNQYVAHRDGQWGIYGEETRPGYNYAASTYPDVALEISFYASSDGVLVASHDQTTDRVFSAGYDIPSTPWSTLQTLTTKVGGYPIATVDQIIADHPNSIFVLENKNGVNNAARAAYVDNLCHGKWISKTSGGNVDWNNASANYGAPAMVYFFPQDIPNAQSIYNQFTQKVSWVWEIADYSLAVGNANRPSASDATTFFNFCSTHNIPTWASIIGSKSQLADAQAAASANGSSYAGVMISNLNNLLSQNALSSFDVSGTGGNMAGQPSPSSSSIQMNGSGSSSAVTSAVASFVMTGVGDAQATPTGTSSFALTGTGGTSASNPASGTAGISLSGAGSARALSVSVATLNLVGSASGVGQVGAALATLNLFGSVGPLIGRTAGTSLISVSGTARIAPAGLAFFWNGTAEVPIALTYWDGIHEVAVLKIDTV